MPTPFPPFSAVLLAGGSSRRMGRDKALLPIAGQPLWERQVELLRALGPEEILVSGPRREGFPAELRCVADDPANAGRGPLAGVTAALREIAVPRALVVAVDLPALSEEFLRALLDQAGEGGLVPRAREGERFLYEPLAAIYPRACLPLAEARLDGEHHSMQRFVGACVDAGLVASWEVPIALRPALRNVNTPADLTSIQGS